MWLPLAITNFEGCPSTRISPVCAGLPSMAAVWCTGWKCRSREMRGRPLFHTCFYYTHNWLFFFWFLDVLMHVLKASHTEVAISPFSNLQAHPPKSPSEKHRLGGKGHGEGWPRASGHDHFQSRYGNEWPVGLGCFYLTLLTFKCLS